MLLFSAAAFDDTPSPLRHSAADAAAFHNIFTPPATIIGIFLFGFRRWLPRYASRTPLQAAAGRLEPRPPPRR
jgi:hypothetical protein